MQLLDPRILHRQPRRPIHRPTQSRFERRRMPMNEFAVEIRKRHPEVDKQLQVAINIHMTLHLRGEV